MMREPILVAALFAPLLLAAEVPEVLALLPEGELVKGATSVVVPPPEIEKYLALVQAAAQKDPAWFSEHARNTPPGEPLPFDPKLGLSQEEYDDYLELWAKREFKAVEPVILSLRQDSQEKWLINGSAGPGTSLPISTLKYDPVEDVWISPNGTLARLEDVKADKNSILGEWTGHEWRFEEENSLGKTKENFALGQTADEVYGLLIYRMQEVSSEGTQLFDKSLVIRFPLGEAGILKEPAQLPAQR